MNLFWRFVIHRLGYFDCFHPVFLSSFIKIGNRVELEDVYPCPRKRHLVYSMIQSLIILSVESPFFPATVILELFRYHHYIRCPWLATLLMTYALHTNTLWNFWFCRTWCYAAQLWIHHDRYISLLTNSYTSWWRQILAYFSFKAL